MSAFVVDTSIFVAVEEEQQLEPYDGLYHVSVATITELEIGVMLARDPSNRRRRNVTLARARAHIPLPYDERVSSHLAALLTKLRRARKKAGAFDCIIAATALAAGLPVYTQDKDFELLRDHAGGPDVVLG